MGKYTIHGSHGYIYHHQGCTLKHFSFVSIRIFAHHQDSDSVPPLPGFDSTNCESWNKTKPKGSMYGIFTYMWLIFMVNVGKYTIHGSYGKWYNKYQQIITASSCPILSNIWWLRPQPLQLGLRLGENGFCADGNWWGIERFPLYI